MFDKKPGEISDVGNVEKKEVNETDGGEYHECESEDVAEVEIADQRVGILSRLWPASSRFFSALGLQRCTIM